MSSVSLSTAPLVATLCAFEGRHAVSSCLLGDSPQQGRGVRRTRLGQLRRP